GRVLEVRVRAAATAGTCRVQPPGGATGGRNLARSNGALLGRSALDRSAEAGAAEERALEDEEAGDWQKAGDEHRREEDAERGLGLDRGQPDRERLLVRVRQDEQRPQEVLPRREQREDRDDAEDRLRQRQHDPPEELEGAGAVDLRRLEDLAWQVVEEARDEDDVERARAGRQPHRPVAVDE